jgi:hypothetical protein
VPWLLGRRSPCTYTRPPWFDHGTRWTRDGKPYCLVGQPYGLSADNLRELLALVDDHGLHVGVDNRPDWHYPGHLLSVVVRTPFAVEQDKIRFDEYMKRKRTANTIKHPSGLIVRKADIELAGLLP